MPITLYADNTKTTTSASPSENEIVRMLEKARWASNVEATQYCNWLDEKDPLSEAQVSSALGPHSGPSPVTSLLFNICSSLPGEDDETRSFSPAGLLNALSIGVSSSNWADQVECNYEAINKVLSQLYRSEDDTTGLAQSFHLKNPREIQAFLKGFPELVEVLGQIEKILPKYFGNMPLALEYVNYPESESDEQLVITVLVRAQDRSAGKSRQEVESASLLQ